MRQSRSAADSVSASRFVGMARTLRPWIIAACFAVPATAADLVTLAPDNFAAFAPRGIQARAFFGDYVLRNDTIVLAVADPRLMSGRSASRWAIENVSGAIIDLTLRDQPNDQLVAYYPAGLRYKPDAPNFQSEFVDERLAATQPDRKPVSGPRVQLRVAPYELGNGQMLDDLAKLPTFLRGEPKPYVEVIYTLEDGWPYVLVETIYHNPTQEPFVPGPFGKLVAGDTAERVDDDDAHFVALADTWWGQGWGVVAEGHRLTLTPAGAGGFVLGFSSADGRPVTVAPGGSLRIARRVFPARNAFELKAIAAPLLGRSVRTIPLELVAPDGPVAEAEVTLLQGEKPFAAARTDAEGRLPLAAPPADCSLRIEPYGREPRIVPLPAAHAGPLQVACGPAGWVAARVTTDAGAAIPCKVRFTGIEGTPDPDFFPHTGEAFVGNLCYAVAGEFRRPLPPGTYEALVTYGPEFDPVRRRIEVVRGQETKLAVALRRSVQTPGWISAELHNHSAVSGRTQQFYVARYAKDRTVDGDSTASPRGRVLNLVCEQVEFAPATEHNFAFSYEPIVRELGAGALLATCPGIGLTAGRRHTVTHQNTFPVIARPGAQDGGALQRPEHIGQLEWLAKWDDGADKLVQVAIPRGAPFRPSRAVDALDVVDLLPLVDDRPYASATAGDNRVLQWIELLNEGYRLPGVVNAGAFDNFHGSGRPRNYVQSPTDDPSAIEPLDVVRAVRRGQVTMTTGPFLEVSASAGTTAPAAPGGTVVAPDGKVSLSVRVQAHDAITIDRVQVLVNGKRSPALTFARGSGGPGFQAGAVQFERAIPLTLAGDGHLIVVASGTGANLRARRDAPDTHVTEVAVSNPMYVDVGEPGYLPRSPLDDRVETVLQFVEPPIAKRAAEPGRVRLILRNRGTEPAEDTATLRFMPEGCARVVGPAELAYALPYQGAEAQLEWKIVFTDEFLERNFPVTSSYNNSTSFGVRVDRGSKPPGRAPAQYQMLVDHHAGSLPALDVPEKVAGALATEVDYPLGGRRIPGLATMRLAVAGSDLAVHFRVVEKQLVRKETVWEGSSIELFACMPGRHPKNTDRAGFWYAVNQVYLAPAVADRPAAGFVRREERIVPAPEIRVTSRPTPEGYELDALVPLELLKIDADEINRIAYLNGASFTDVSLLGLEPRAGRFMFDARVNTVAAPGQSRKRPTLFGSAAPHVDSSAFGTMRVEGRVDCRVNVIEAPAVGAAARPGRVRVSLRNRSDAPAADVVTLDVRPADAARVAGDATLRFALAPGADTSREFSVVLRDATTTDSIDLVVPRSPGGEVASTPAPRMTIEGRTIARLPAITVLEAVRPALAGFPPTAIRLDGKPVGTVRFALAGNDLAVDAELVDREIVQSEPAWEGSSFEIFGARAPGASIGQVFLIPAAGAAPARGLRASQGKITPHPGIRLQSRPIEQGYAVQALIPLDLLAFDAESPRCLLEFQLTALFEEAKRRTGTAFGSPRAYQDNLLYGRFRVAPADPVRAE